MDMKNDSTWGIIRLCSSINQKAIQIYTKLSQTEEITALKTFWVEMAEEEKIHAVFWNKIEQTAKDCIFPSVFDTPSDIQKELSAILDKIEVLSSRWEERKSMENALILAYRLEYYMLHPTFKVLFNALKPLGGDIDPSDTHDCHIRKFMDMFIQYSHITPELELLGETLQSLWRRNKILANIAMTDGLTGLFNRRGFLIVAKELFSLAERRRENIAVFMIDIDHFKKINDRYGHPRGDTVLKGVAKSLKGSVRKSDVLCRYGGEEFVILFSNILTPSVPLMAEKIRKDVEKSRPDGIFVTISIGVTQGLVKKGSGNSFSSWISRADKYLYKAKANGRNCVVHDCCKGSLYVEQTESVKSHPGEIAQPVCRNRSQIR
ncbi:GGDEF domain-containing protein [uncultured Desulfobacter sp.]|uniref:GGDEF domain-containing protein n=1 Tax=uncultured Desulfobacter sp. TaxID=240139 RepID=UPI002AAAAF79|nr:GGDEF domain-containing protein [uncultured Desulfobacter sp.]